MEKIKVDLVKINNKEMRGVVATKAIKKGTLIDENPLLIIPSEENQGTIERYSFDYNGAFCAIALGKISLINHSKNPNAVVEMNDEYDMTFQLYSLRDIKKGEQILIDYKYSAEGFEKLGIKNEENKL